jgi:poly(hydroxyalkanoate) depolymerase family esterase
MIPSSFSLQKTFVLLLIAVWCSGSDYLIAQTLKEADDFGENPGNLRMFYYQPASVSTAKPKTPLVVVLHGCTQSAGVIAAQTGWNKLADEYGFVVLYPQQKFINNPERCFCWYKRGDITKGKGEDESIIEMIDYMRAHFRTDSSRVFITGLSAGAIMSVVMMATYPETFNAGAIFAGGPYKATTSVFMAYPAMKGWVRKTPAKWGLKVKTQNRGYVGNYPRMIIYQGNKDPIVNRRNGFELVKQWTNLHHVDTVPLETTNHYAGITDIQRNTYGDKNNPEAVVYYKINRLGHAYLINPGHCINEGGKRGIFSKDKNYHATWWTALDFGLTNLSTIQGKTEVTAAETDLVYSIRLNPGSTYTWTYPEGCTVTKGQQTPEITLTWGQKGGRLMVEETTASGCRLFHPALTIIVVPK